MASYGTAFTDTSALTFGDDPTGGSWPLGNVARVQLVRHVVGDSTAALAWACAAMAEPPSRGFPIGSISVVCARSNPRAISAFVARRPTGAGD
jgi:hypothetical protein